MGNFVDLVGQRFGKLEVLQQAPHIRDKVAWLCKCDCGGRKAVVSYHLVAGKAKSCGCLYYVDITGQRFGRLQVLGLESRNGKSFWRCQCDCGNETVADLGNLKVGHVRSCGCLARDLARERSKTHGLSHHQLYGILCGMVRRCSKPNCREYSSYGGRGITVHQEWVDNPQTFIDYVEERFPNIYELLNQRYSIDRIDVNGNYEPGNVKFSSLIDQANNKRNNKYITAFGETLSLAQQVRKNSVPGLGYEVVARRIREGWDAEKALSTPRIHNFGLLLLKDDFSIHFRKTEELCTHFGISYKVVKKRRDMGWSLLEAATTSSKCKRLSLDLLKRITSVTINDDSTLPEIWRS